MPDENSRLSRLHRLKLLDTAPDPLFERIVARALTTLPGTSISAISLVDRHRQWFKAIVGLDARQTPRAVSFCAHTIQGNGPLVVEDASNDPRFADNRLVTASPHIRFYAGVPLVGGVGALCVISSAPRQATADELAKLVALATEVNTQLMLHATLANLKRDRPA